MPRKQSFAALKARRSGSFDLREDERSSIDAISLRVFPRGRFRPLGCPSGEVRVNGPVRGLPTVETLRKLGINRLAHGVEREGQSAKWCARPCNWTTLFPRLYRRTGKRSDEGKPRSARIQPGAVNILACELQCADNSILEERPNRGRRRSLAPSRSFAAGGRT